MSVNSSSSVEIQSSRRDEKSIGDDIMALYRHDMTQHPRFESEEVLVPLTVRVQDGISAQTELDELDQSANVDTLTIQRRHQLAKVAIDGINARNEMVTANAALVVHFAPKYLGQGLDLLDLIQEGNIGLMRAAEKYDPNNSQKAKFSTYAKNWILAGMENALHNQARLIRIPRDKSMLIHKMKTIERNHVVATGKTMSSEELNKAMKLPESKVKDLQTSVWNTLSVNLEVGEPGGAELESVIVDPTTPSVEDLALGPDSKKPLVDEIQKMLANSTLSSEAREILWMYFAEGQSIETIADVTSYNTKSVGMRANKALKKLRDEINDEGKMDYFRELLSDVE